MLQLMQKRGYLNVGEINVYGSLEEVYELELGVLLSKLEASGIDTSKLTIVEDGR
jgi:hypothetical protein